MLLAEGIFINWDLIFSTFINYLIFGFRFFIEIMLTPVCLPFFCAIVISIIISVKKHH